jgi:hypothetical protein
VNEGEHGIYFTCFVRGRGVCYSRREKFCFETNGQVHVTVRCDKYPLLLHLPAPEAGHGLRKSLADSTAGRPGILTYLPACLPLDAFRSFSF